MGIVFSTYDLLISGEAGRNKRRTSGTGSHRNSESGAADAAGCSNPPPEEDDEFGKLIG